MVPDSAWTLCRDAMDDKVGFPWAMRFTDTHNFEIVDHMGARAISLHQIFDPAYGVDLNIHNISLYTAKIYLDAVSFPVWRGHQIVVPIPEAHINGHVFTVHNGDMLIVSKETHPSDNVAFQKLVLGFRSVSTSMPSR